MFGISLGSFVVLAAVLMILPVWWEPPSAADGRAFVVSFCCFVTLLAGFFFGVSVLSLLDSFAVGPSTVAALTTASMIAALSRIAYKAVGRSGLAVVLSIAVLAG